MSDRKQPLVEIRHNSDFAEFEDWVLNFTITVPEYGVVYEFVVHEPYLIPWQEWVNFSTGKCRNIEICGGNSNASINVKEDVVTIETRISGMGGDNETKFSLPYSDVAPKLLAAISYAKFHGYNFRE